MWFGCCLLPFLRLDVKGWLAASWDTSKYCWASFCWAVLKESGWMIQGKMTFLSVWRKNCFVLDLSCWEKCHQSGWHPRCAPCSVSGQKREWWERWGISQGVAPWGRLSPHLSTCPLLFPLPLLSACSSGLINLLNWFGIFSFCM